MGGDDLVALLDGSFHLGTAGADFWALRRVLPGSGHWG